jgi:hypothetical protein
MFASASARPSGVGESAVLGRPRQRGPRASASARPSAAGKSVPRALVNAALHAATSKSPAHLRPGAEGRAYCTVAARTERGTRQAQWEGAAGPRMRLHVFLDGDRPLQS